jgi:glutamate-5-semialdehyde dehydrogenase
MAVKIVVNSKCQRVEVCNALETLLVDAAGALRLLPPVVEALRAQGVECRGCEASRAVVPGLLAATEEDWGMEYLAPIIAIRVVDDLPAAIAHINRYGSGHTDGIVTNRDYGLGAVVGISTDKLHARGPVGPNELTSTKWIARGNGHLRA